MRPCSWPVVHAARAHDASDTALARLKTAYQNVALWVLCAPSWWTPIKPSRSMVVDLQSQRDPLQAQVSDLTKKVAAQQDADTK